MKKVLSFLSIMLMAANTLQAQNKFIGSWQGSLNVGKELRLIFNIKADEKGVYSATMDSPDQGATGIPCSGVSIHGDSISVEMVKIRGVFDGVMQDANNINGKWTQAGNSLPMKMKRMEKPLTLNRPQTPQAPFNYIIEDVVYPNKDKTMEYGATITIPKGKGPFPALVMITGSGPQNRDEELFGHKPFAVIADYLTNHGYIVLRVDDRGMGKTTGKFRGSTSADFAKDVNTSVDYLKTRKEVDVKKIGLMGHSEGGMIAPMVASERKDIDFIILEAGPGVKIAQLMEEQNAAILGKTGKLSEDAIAKYSLLYRNIAKDIVNAKDSIEARKVINRDVDAWKTTTAKEIVESTTGITDEDSQASFVDGFMEIYTDAWFRYFFSFDPQVYLRKLSCKVLALNGDKDIQVLSKSSIPGIRESLAKSKSKVYEAREIPGLNHLFQHCKTCTVNEYGQLEETFAPEVLGMIVDWLDKNVK
ncbi:MAG: alpha/beta fold hydrolase [Bacteroidota bacterium]